MNNSSVTPIGIPMPMMAHRFRTQVWDNHGTEIEGLSITTMGVIVRSNEIELRTILTVGYPDIPDIMHDADSLTILVEILDGNADQKILKGIKRVVRIKDAEMKLDYDSHTSVSMVYTLETINTNLEESN